MSDQLNGVNGNNAQPTLSFAFTVAEWSVIRTALYEAPLPAKFTTPVIGKLEQALMQAQNAVTTTEEARQGSVQ